jgi:hypothetical protein
MTFARSPVMPKMTSASAGSAPSAPAAVAPVGWESVAVVMRRLSDTLAAARITHNG